MLLVRRSWSAPRNLSSLHDEKHRRYDGSRGIWCQTSAAGGSGIQTSSGRLVIPAYHYDCPHIVEASNMWISVSLDSPSCYSVELRLSPLAHRTITA